MQHGRSISGAVRLRRGLAALLLAALAAPLAVASAADVPDGDSSPYHQAFLNYQAGNYDAARLAIEDAQRESPDNINTAILKARILAQLGDFDGARRTLESLNNNPHLTPADGDNITLAWADLCLHKRDFDGASKFYQNLLNSSRAGDPDIELRLVYARVGAGDNVDALKVASQLKPLDPQNPAYYFAKAALANATGDSATADQDIQTARTIYGITTTNHYLRTYLQVFAGNKGGVNARSEPPRTNAPAAAPGQP